MNVDETGVDCGGSSCSPCCKLYEMAIFVILYVAIKVGYLIVIAIILIPFLISRKRGEILLGALQLYTRPVFVVWSERIMLH